MLILICVHFVITTQKLYSIYFYEYTQVKALWNSVQDWVVKTTGIVVHFDKLIVMFGMVNSKYSNIINWLIINIKYYVYTMKMQKQKLPIASVQSILQNKFHIERYISFQNCNYDIFRNEWEP